MGWVENGMLLLGLMVVCLSYLHYVRRTHDLRGVLLFWQRRMALTPGEFKLQRAGIVVLFVGILIRYLNLTLWG
ncbi:hypothetical protein [Salinicola avicenniae]|uniref:hypothetical protein n=1 Tax=Salinicola avicenniae TaxID=2916836 RepID=UPI002073C826|nr:MULTISPECIES: hypothetical protein [unclassified Salinicola]